MVNRKRDADSRRTKIRPVDGLAPPHQFIDSFAHSRNEVSEYQYSTLFKYLPIPIWREDFSKIKSYFDNLKKKGIKDLRRYLEKHPEEVLSLSQKVKIIEVNDAALKLYAADSKDELCKGLNSVFSKESFDVFREEIIALSEGKTEFQSEAVNLTLKGEEIHILLRLNVMPDHAQTLSSVVVSTIDITGMKRLEEDLRESEEKYRRIFETAHDALLVADTDTGIILEANKEAEELFGRPADEIVGMHFTQLHPKEETDILREQFKDHVSRRGEISENIVICHKGGGRVPVSIRSSVIQIKGRKYISAIFRQMPNNARPKVQNVNREATQMLSARECEVVRLIASGLTSKEVAENLHISNKTVQTHRTRIMHKLNLHRVNDLVRFAVTSGLFE